MEHNANWFHVFDATANQWLQEDEQTWGPYSGAAEFSSLELARDVATREMANGNHADAIILGDFGVVE